MLVGPSPSLIARLDNDVLPKLAQHNSLRDGVVAADQYCRMWRMRCDFILKPTLLTRDKPRGPELDVAHSLNNIYPRYGEMIATMVIVTGVPRPRQRSDRPPPPAGRKDGRILAKRKKACFKPPDTFKRMRMP